MPQGVHTEFGVSIFRKGIAPNTMQDDEDIIKMEVRAVGRKDES
jgi:hypothetical protein